MNKIEKLIEQIKSTNQLGERYFELSDLEQRIEQAMREYAEFYAKKCLKLADGEFGWDHDFEHWYSETKPSDIDLPFHG